MLGAAPITLAKEVAPPRPVGGICHGQSTQQVRHAQTEGAQTVVRGGDARTVIAIARAESSDVRRHGRVWHRTGSIEDSRGPSPRHMLSPVE